MKRIGQKQFKGFILVEVETLTTPKLKKEDNYIGEIAKLIQKTNNTNKEYRLQAILSDDQYSPLDSIKVIFYLCDQTNYNSFTKTEYEIIPEDLVSFIDGVLKDSKKIEYTPLRNTSRDLLVCTHALRDKCCGRFGYPIYQFLRSHVSKSHDVRIWRSSHLTGHRMAPTMLDLPEGRYWGYLNQKFVRKLLKREELDPSDIDKHYRGRAGLTPEEQVVEKEVLKKELWSLLETSIQIESKSVDNNVLVTLSWDDKQIQHLVSPPQELYIGKTKCALVKPAKRYTLTKPE